MNKKPILISQRVDVHPDYGERRDALDQMWWALLEQVGCFPVIVPNHPPAAAELIQAFQAEGVLLSGGNNPVSYGGSAPERDQVDTLLLECAVRQTIPLLGVCRGMQSVVLHFGGALGEVQGHVAVRHHVGGEIAREVNSYHGYAPLTVPECLRVLARSEDGSPEAVRHTSLPIWGMMWHPEREKPFQTGDIALLKKIYQSK